MPSFECPNCHKTVHYRDLKEVPSRPFCSDRCKMVDLGKWLNEEFRIREDVPPELLEEEREQQDDNE